MIKRATVLHEDLVLASFYQETRISPPPVIVQGSAMKRRFISAPTE